MMQKLLVSLALVLALAVASPAAAGRYGDAGCGFGSMIFQNEKGPVVQVLASITNVVLLYNQTWAITTGISNCDPMGLVKVDKVREVFAQNNYPNLVREMAQGEGENLQTLASLYGCGADSSGRFGALAQNHFADIVKDESTSSGDMLAALEAHLARDENLSRSCAALAG